MKRTALIIILSVCIHTSVLCQHTDQTGYRPATASDTIVNPCLGRNIMYFTGGILIGTYYGGNYERIFLSNKRHSVQVLARIGIGKVHMKTIGLGIGFFAVLYAWEEEYDLMSYFANVGILAGRRSSHLDACVGIAYLDGTRTVIYRSIPEEVMGHQEVNPLLSLGYRYQKPGGHFLFRVGAGWPEQVYLSLGCCF